MILPADFDVLSEESSKRMPKSQLLRRSFGNPQHTSPGSKRGSMRINKPSVASTCPQDIQRRRTTASHTVRASRTGSQTCAGYGQSTIGGSAWPGQSRRPMSWHPGSAVHQDSAAVHLPNDYNLGNTIAELETLAVSGPIQPVFEEPANSGNLSIGSEPSYDPSTAGYADWNNLATKCTAPYPSYLGHNVSTTNQYFVQTPYDCVYGQTGFPTSGFIGVDSISSDYQAPGAMEMLPIQYPANLAYSEPLQFSPQIVTKKSKELVGMGLYDDKNGTMVSTADATGTQSPNLFTNMHRTSAGKGLKLEETWQPPGEETTGDAEDYSSDEAEDELPVAPPSQQSQTQVFADYKDLSNQTFFFENDDQYQNYIAFDQAMQFCEPKAPDASSGNFLWI